MLSASVRFCAGLGVQAAGPGERCECERLKRFRGRVLPHLGGRRAVRLDNTRHTATKKSEQCTVLYASTSPYDSLRTYLLCTPAARDAPCGRYVMVSQLLHCSPRKVLKGVTGNNYTRKTFTINKLNGCQLFTRQTAAQASTDGCEWRQLNIVYSVAGK